MYNRQQKKIRNINTKKIGVDFDKSTPKFFYFANRKLFFCGKLLVAFETLFRSLFFLLVEFFRKFRFRLFKRRETYFALQERLIIARGIFRIQRERILRLPLPA